MANIHPFDDAVQEVIDWIHDEADYYVEALKAGHQTPFSADVTEAQKLDYYRRQVFATGPDGQPDPTRPNQQGRNALIDRIGLKGYAEVMSQVLPRRQMSPTIETPEYPGEGSE